LHLLSEDCPTCRIMTFGYDSKITRIFDGPANQSSIFGHSRDLLYVLARNRLNCRFVTFVAHFLGGKCLHESEDRLFLLLETFRPSLYAGLIDVQNSTKGIFFLGTLHRGSAVASMGEALRRLVAVCGFDKNDKNIRALRFDSTELEISREAFMRQWRQEEFLVRTFQESQSYKNFSSSLDDLKEHAEHINANHFGICRFMVRDDPGYKQVGGELCKIVDKFRRECEELEQTRLEKQASSLSCLSSSAPPPF
ncbi:hypothetical protein B0J13DRAFT_412232, partial [Dactylonectria estremocensis]